MRKLLIAGLIAALLILPPVFADVSENFDTYRPGTASPVSAGNPWTLTSDLSGGAFTTCFAGSGVTYIGGAPVVNSYTPPNVYGLVVSSSGTCTGHFVELSATINATQSGLIADYFRRATISASGVNATWFLCGKDVFHELLSAMPSTYTRLNESAPATPASTCTLIFEMQIISGGTATSWLFDNLYIHGANLVYSDADIFLLDSATRLQFNMTQYPGSFMVANYSLPLTCGAPLVQASPNSCIANGITSSYVDMPLSASTLLTLHLGQSVISGVTYPPFYRSMIPNSTSHQVMLLDTANKITAYSLTVNDIGKVFGPGSEIFLTQDGAVIVSGYLDSGSQFAAYVPPGIYSLRLIQGTSNYAAAQNFGSVQAITISINKFTTATSPGSISTETYFAGWGCNSNNQSVASYGNSLLLTTKVVFNIFNQTSTGTFLVESETVTGTIGTAQTTFTGIVPADGSYEVQFQVFDNMGFHYLGPIPLANGNPSCPGVFPSILPTLPAFPDSVFGLDQFIRTANGWNGILAVFVILLTAGVFGARNSAFGFFVVALEVMFFFLSLFIPSTYTIIYTFVLSSAVGFLVYRRRRTVMVSQ